MKDSEVVETELSKEAPQTEAKFWLNESKEPSFYEHGKNTLSYEDVLTKMNQKKTFPSRKRVEHFEDEYDELDHKLKS